MKGGVGGGGRTFRDARAVSVLHIRFSPETRMHCAIVDAEPFLVYVFSRFISGEGELLTWILVKELSRSFLPALAAR